MTATEELRRMLGEAGIEWEGREDIHTDFTFWCGVHACETGPKPSLAVYHLTPEQAIAATVGAGTCKVETTENWLPAERYHRCKHCGAFFAVLDASGDIPPRVCPNCGAKVVDT